MSDVGRIDTHQHFVPPKYDEVIKREGSSEFMHPSWSVAGSQANNKQNGTSFCFLSLTSPGPEVATCRDEAREIARDSNLHGASARDQNPHEFGFYAAIPSPVQDMQGALDEIAYAYDTLHTDGVTLFTSYSGKYLGDAALEPLWAELNRRKAVVFIHPTSAADFKPWNRLMPAPAVDFTFETTKTALDLIISKTVRNNADCKIILSHAGGTLPFVWSRPGLLLASMRPDDWSMQAFRDDALAFYYDTACATGPMIEILLKFAKPDHILYGSDYPYAPAKAIQVLTADFDRVLAQTDEATRQMINRDNARKLFPRLAKASTTSTATTTTNGVSGNAVQGIVDKITHTVASVDIHAA